MEIPDAAPPPLASRHLRFLIGIALIVLSFLVYPAFIVILFLPLSPQMKVAAVAAASVMSWAAFSAGIFLTGRRGYHWCKQQWKARLGLTPLRERGSGTPGSAASIRQARKTAGRERSSGTLEEGRK